MKKILSAALAVLMLSAAFAAAIPAFSEGSTHFSDVAEGDWYSDPVSFVYENGLMVGVADGVFAPDAPMTRAMFVTVLYRLSGETAAATDAFSDVSSSEWYARAVGWAHGAGIVEGYPDGTFRPDGLLTREEAAAAVVRYGDCEELRIPKHSSTAPKEFADDGEIAEWAKGDVDALRVAEVFRGDENVNFNPSASLTRAEAFRASSARNSSRTANIRISTSIPTTRISTSIISRTTTKKSRSRSNRTSRSTRSASP